MEVLFTASGSSASSLKGPWSSVLYVDQVYGNDVTAQRGNDNRPFATIQAAINAMLTSDTVWIAPQAFTLTAALTVPATVVTGSIRGMPAPSSGLSVSTSLRRFGANVFDFGANLGISNFLLHGLNINGNIVADGSAYAAGTYFTNGLLIDSCTYGTGLTVIAKYVKNYEMRNCSGPQAAAGFTHTTCGTVKYTGCLFGGFSSGTNVVATFDGTDPLAPPGATPGEFFIVDRTSFGTDAGSTGVTVGGQTRLIVDQTSTISGLRASAAVPLSVIGAKVPSVVCTGYINSGNSGVIDFASAGQELPDTATALVFDFRGARLYGEKYSGVSGSVAGPTTVKFKVGGAAANFQTVKFDSSTALPGVTFSADVKIHLTMRGADAPQPIYQTPGADGDIVPPMLTGTVNIAAGGTVAKVWAADLGYTGLVRTGAAPDTAFVTSIAPLADAVIPTKAVTGLTFTSVAAGGNTAANWQAIWK